MGIVGYIIIGIIVVVIIAAIMNKKSKKEDDTQTTGCTTCAGCKFSECPSRKKDWK